MFEKLLKQWANEQGFETWSQDHAAVLRNLVSWLNMHAVEQTRALDGACESCKLEFTSSCPIRTGNGCDLYQPRQ